MRLYTVKDNSGEYADFYTATDAKRYMKEHEGSTCSIYIVSSNGNFEPAGSLSLEKSNARILVGATRQTVENYR